MAEREIGVGIVGFGLGGRVFHAPFVNAVGGLRLAAICQRHGDEAAKAYPAAEIVRSLSEMLAKPAIDLIVITTPSATHFALAKEAIEAGKHVVIDKPFTATSEQAAELSQLAGSRELLAVPFHNRRWDGDFLTVKKLIADQAVGRLVTFELHFDRFRPIPRAGKWQEAANLGEWHAVRPRTTSRRSGAGALRAAGRDYRERPHRTATTLRSRMPSTLRSAIRGRTARGCWRIAGPATSPARMRGDSRRTEREGVFANTGSIPRRPRWSAAPRFPQRDRRKTGCWSQSGRGAALTCCPRSGGAGVAGREPGEDRGRRLSRLLSKCARRHPRSRRRSR